MIFLNIKSLNSNLCVLIDVNPFALLQDNSKNLYFLAPLLYLWIFGYAVINLNFNAVVGKILTAVVLLLF
jgi:hypothetical protein